MDLVEIKKTLDELNQKYWFSFQSPKMCKIGSDGVGHDQIHDLDKLQTACRNAHGMLSECQRSQEELVLEEIKLKRLEQDRSDISYRLSVSVMAVNDPRMELDLLEKETLIKRQKRIISETESHLGERLLALSVFSEHIDELYLKVKDKYDSYDDGIEECWAARIAYNAVVKNHPLGQDLKVALMSEEKKQSVLKFMDFPESIKDQSGRVIPLLAPNADNVIQALNKFLEKRKELNDGKGLRD